MSGPNYIQTIRDDFRKGYDTNVSTSNVSSTDVLINKTAMTRANGYMDTFANFVELLFFGTDAGAEAFDAYVTFYRELQGSVYFVKTSGVLVTATMHADLVGVAGTPVINTERFADTLVLNASEGDQKAKIIDGTDGKTPASLILDARGAKFVRVQFSLTTAASANYLVSNL